MTPLTQPISTPSFTSHPPEDDQSGTSEDEGGENEVGCKEGGKNEVGCKEGGEEQRANATW